MEDRSLDGDAKALELLRTKGLSIRNLSEPGKTELRDFVHRVHVVDGVSLSDLARMIGNKTSGYTSWLCRELGVRARPFKEARLKGIREKRRKYERKPFDGTDEDRAYMLGLRHGDLSVSRPWKGVVRVSTSTTHPAMADLFDSVFGSSGHVYRYPRYKKDTGTYEWNLSTILDDTFGFLDEVRTSSLEWAKGTHEKIKGYLAGFFDAEGSIGIYRAGKNTELVVAYYNTDLGLLRSVAEMISILGFSPLPPYLDKPKGFRSPGFHIEMKKNYWRVLLASLDEARAFLSVLPLRHWEKTEKRKIARELSHRQRWSEVEPRVVALRRTIREDRDRFVQEAKSAVALRQMKQMGTAFQG